jgi:DNA-binding response OmpR family regulator
MSKSRVLIVEDDALVALDVSQALHDAGFEVCGVAASEDEAIEEARRTRPDFAIVDVSLSPGDGRAVARALSERRTAVLFATGQCEDVRRLAGSGAVACLPKPYDAADVPRALRVVANLREGRPPGPKPDSMFALA